MNLPIKLRRFLALALGLGLVSVTSFAEDSSSTLASPPTAAPAGQSTTVTAANPEPTSKFFATLDMRAEFYSVAGAWDTSNYTNIGYQFNPNFKMSWYQGFDSNLYSAAKVGSVGGPLYSANTAGLNGVLDQGYLRTKVDNIWKSGQYAFNYESRIYVPTWAFDSQVGNIVRFYNAFKFIDHVSDVVTLTAQVIVSPQVFKYAGTTLEGPNPAWENRYYLIADFQISKKWSFTLPVLMYQDKYRDYDVAGFQTNSLLGGHSGDWGYFLYIWPELDYALNDNLTLGLAYVSGNMALPDLSGFQLGNAFHTGITQFVVTMNM